MKSKTTNTLLVILTITFGNYIKAEIPQGRKSIGGALSFSANRQLATHTYNNSSVTHIPRKYFNYSVLPEFALFIRPNLSIGVNAGYMHFVSHEYYQGFKQKSSSSIESRIPANIICNKYFDLSGEFSFWAGVNAGLAFSKYKVTNNILTPQPDVIKTDGYTIQAGLQFGFIWFPVQKIGITLGVSGMGYEKIRDDEVSVYNSRRTTKTDNFHFNLNVARLSLGINYFLNVK